MGGSVCFVCEIWEGGQEEKHQESVTIVPKLRGFAVALDQVLCLP